MVWKLASKLTTVVMDEVFDYYGGGEVVSSWRANQEFLMCGKIFDVLCKHEFEIKPEYARYWLPYDGAPVYRIAGGEGERPFVERCEFNLFAPTFTNVLALGRLIFLTKEEAEAALRAISD
jgi:hypothetical protein